MTARRAFFLFLFPLAAAIFAALLAGLIAMQFALSVNAMRTVLAASSIGGYFAMALLIWRKGVYRGSRRIDF
jgi:hypothetical protein